MSYQALIFCQDEKTARTVTQVLSELDFQVDLCSETFAAVKKLTSQAFEAIVVDCQNEENASLLLKSARNSTSNQASLMVALVDGQAGVAAAFRIGANLVLTKPIAVEQARGTLRVARGLLRRNTTAATPPNAAPPIVPASAPALPPTATVQLPAPTPPLARPAALAPIAPKLPVPPPAVAFTPKPSALQASASSNSTPSSSLESETEHQPAPDAASAGLLESLDFKTFEPAPANSYQSAAPETEIVSVSEIKTGAQQAVRAVFNSEAIHAAGQMSGSQGAAVAPARELPPSPSPKPQLTDDIFEPAVFGQTTSVAAAEPESPSFTAPAASRSKAPLFFLAAAVIVAALYFGWSQMHKPVPTALSTPTAGPLQPPAPDYPTPGGDPQAATAHTPQPDAATQPAPAESDNRFAHPTRSVTPAVADNTISAPAAVVAPKHSTPLQIKTQLQRVRQAATNPDIAEAPSIAGLGATARPDALNTIAHSAATPLPVIAQAHPISQGVSEGLLLKRVQPSYPAQALQMHIQGTVSLRATIAKDGSIRDVKVISGPPQLARAASDAVRQWKYRPYTLNGEPVEIQTEININFVPPR